MAPPAETNLSILLYDRLLNGVGRRRLKEMVDEIVAEPKKGEDKSDHEPTDHGGFLKRQGSKHSFPWS